MSRLRPFELSDGLKARVDALLAPPAAQSIADLQQHFADDVHATPAQLAAYRHRLSEYARSGTPQRDLDLEPPSCA